MRKILCVLFVIFLLIYPSTATAANINSESEIEYFDDGSYIITTIDVEVQPTIALFSKTVTKSKTAKYYSGNVAKWYVKVTGTFTYGNGSAKCTKSTVTAVSYTNNLKITSKSASKSGNTASAKGVAKRYYGGTVIETLAKNVKLTCSSAGKFS